MRSWANYLVSKIKLCFIVWAHYSLSLDDLNNSACVTSNTGCGSVEVILLHSVRFEKISLIGPPCKIDAFLFNSRTVIRGKTTETISVSVSKKVLIIGCLCSMRGDQD